VGPWQLRPKINKFEIIVAPAQARPEQRFPSQQLVSKGE